MLQLEEARQERAEEEAAAAAAKRAREDALKARAVAKASAHQTRGALTTPPRKGGGNSKKGGGSSERKQKNHRSPSLGVDRPVTVSVTVESCEGLPGAIIMAGEPLCAEVRLQEQAQSTASIPCDAGEEGDCMAYWAQQFTFCDVSSEFIRKNGGLRCMLSTMDEEGEPFFLSEMFLPLKPFADGQQCTTSYALKGRDTGAAGNLMLTVQVRHTTRTGAAVLQLERELM